MRWRLNAWAVTGLAALGSAVLETLHYVLDLGRVTAVDDVLINGAGAGLAAVLARRWHRRAQQPDAPSPSR
ncbi:VanZ family protein [Dactylosporangium sp. NPDC051484]|uniref:VanZ family protein n=1 Tax=Dactylosporangium sp. NPDC051484 TaxID=3154942 RepID=UPI00344C47CA